MKKQNLHQLAALSHHLSTRRPALLEAWLAASDADPQQTTADAMTRAQFFDHMPEVLDALKARLLGRPEDEDEAVSKQKVEAAKHGLQRWQQGYRLREMTREWGILHICLHNELEAFGMAHPDADREMMSHAHCEVIKLINTAVNESLAQYLRMERDTAAGRARDLELAVAQFAELERQRGQLMRQAVHDLGGNMQAVSSAASLLSTASLPEEERHDMSELIQRGVHSLSKMLRDLMSLARLEAGEEKRKQALFDAAATLAQLCDVSEPIAAARSLTLERKGPTTLMVEGDEDKVHRIAQNLLLNALKYTEEGGVTVSWGEEGAEKWWLMVKDTGPGLLGGPGSPMVDGLKEATAIAREADESAVKAGEKTIHVIEQKEHTDTVMQHQRSGEGIGLAIVKRLCDLLDASLEVASSAQEGTTFRVLLPRSYGK